MTAITHNAITANYGEPIAIEFTVTDGDGNAQSLVGASASYRLARDKGLDAVLEKTNVSGITLSTNKATVRFNTTELLASPISENVEFWGELWITIGSDSLIVANGYININPSLQV